jgi:hypothetical protein
MWRNLVVSGVTALTLAASGVMGGAIADDGRDGYPAGQGENRSQLENVAILRTLGTVRYYGFPEYRCRRFSSVCYHYRPVYYGHYRLTSHLLRRDRSTRHVPVVRPGRYRVDTHGTVPATTSGETARGGPGAGETVVLEVSGAFARVAAPGHAARWIRSDILPGEK